MAQLNDLIVTGASRFLNTIQGTAASASALTTQVGSSTSPVYIGSAGTPVAINAAGITVNNATNASKVAGTNFGSAATCAKTDFLASGAAAASANKTTGTLTLQTAGVTKATFNGNTTTFNVTTADLGIDTAGLKSSSDFKPASNKYAGSTVDGGMASVAHSTEKSLTLQLNGGTSTAWNGSAAVTFNVTPSAIGASATGHSHTTADITNFTSAVQNTKVNNAGTADLGKRRIFIQGNQTAPTTGGAWTGDASEYFQSSADLVDGQEITYWVPLPTTGNVTLNLKFGDGTSSGAVACYYGNTSRLTTHYGQGQAVHLTYRKNVKIPSTGTSTYTGWWADANYDSNSNTIDVLQGTYTIPVAGATAGLKQYSLFAQDANGKYSSFTTQNGTAVTKTVNRTDYFDISKIYYCSTSGNYATNANIGTSIVRWASALIDLRYTLNISSSALTARKPLYLIFDGTATTANALGDTLYKLAGTGTTDWWTQTLPASADGKIYAEVSRAVYDGYRGDLVVNHRYYTYTDKLHCYDSWNANVTRDTILNKLSKEATWDNNYGLVIGDGTTASGYASFAGGTETLADGYASLAFGDGVQALGQAGVAFGMSSTVDGQCGFTAGSNNITSAACATTLGSGCTAESDTSLAGGLNSLTTTSAESGLAFGEESTSDGEAAIALGSYTAASNKAAFAVNLNTRASGAYSAAFGTNTTASASQTLAAGQQTIANVNSQVAIGNFNSTVSDGAFIIGNGTATNARSNALYVTTAGTLTIPAYNNMLFSFKKSSSDKNVDIGWDWSLGYGAGMALRSKEDSDPGSFVLWARKATDANYELKGRPGGVLTWNGKRVVTSTNAAAVGGVTTPVYVNASGYTSACTSVNLPTKEALLQWGGKNFAADFSPLDAAMIDSLGANRFAFIKASAITIEYTRDGGTTWTDYGAADAYKQQLFSTGEHPFYIGKADSDNKATAHGTDYQLRVTINTGVASVYTVLNKFVIYLSTNGSNDCTCKIQKALESTPDTYVDVTDDVPVSGWSGYNVINTSGITTYGNSASAQYGRVRFIFKANGGNTNYLGLIVNSIQAFGGVGWNTPSRMAKTGHLYNYDYNQNAIFPNGIFGQNQLSVGYQTSVSGVYAQALGYFTTASSTAAHAEGFNSRATSTAAHAEGYQTTSSGIASHTEGIYTLASGNLSHAEGLGSSASGEQSHAGGAYTIANIANQTAIGKYNSTVSGALFIVGNGTGTAARSNAMYVTTSGGVHAFEGFYLDSAYQTVQLDSDGLVIAEAGGIDSDGVSCTHNAVTITTDGVEYTYLNQYNTIAGKLTNLAVPASGTKTTAFTVSYDKVGDNKPVILLTSNKANCYGYIDAVSSDNTNRVHTITVGVKNTANSAATAALHYMVMPFMS